ncbi:unnamed protein product [Calicophoron daubneyi]|uniref:Atos-like conserved domain-containing protein n=1 Tax=Calicophoron daubneyi TaxID=300641 RepID=A0AAV2TSF0_CALDB
MIENSKNKAITSKKATELKSTRDAFVIGSVAQCIVMECKKFYSNLIEYVNMGAPSWPAEFVNENDYPQGQSLEKLPIQKNNCLMVETLLLGENCMEHCGDNRIPVLVCEQWIVRRVPLSPSEDCSTAALSHSTEEIKKYFKTSPLSCWLKQHGVSKRQKLAHRCCTIQEAHRDLGVSFLMNITELSSGVSSSESEPDACDGRNGDKKRTLSRLIGKNTFSHLAPERLTHSNGSLVHTFLPIIINATEQLSISVAVPKQLPSHPPECPFCVPPVKESKTVDTDSINLVIPGFPTSPKPLQPCVVDRRCTPGADGGNSLTSRGAVSRPTNFQSPPSPSSFLNLPSGFLPQKETVKSPMVVMTSVNDSFFPEALDNSVCGMLPFGTDFEFNDSATSTLTKKSRVVNSNESAALPLESPPRKQQRIVNNLVSDDSNGSKITSPSTCLTGQSGTGSRGVVIDKVIAKFNMLNVERTEAESTATVKQVNLTSKDAGPSASFYTPMSEEEELRLTAKQTKSNDISKPKDNLSRSAKKREHGCSNGNSVMLSSKDNSSLPASSVVNSDHYPRQRRRNATSTCCSSCTFSWRRESMPFFNRRTGLPLQSSPVPLKRSTSGKFDFDSSLCPLKSSNSSTCMVSELTHPDENMSAVLNEFPTSRGFEHSQKITTSTGGGIQLRRRPASLRLPAQSGEDSRHGVAARRRICVPEVDQAEISCSAPPSGNRGLRLDDNIAGRLPNTLACTPASHGSSQHLLVNFEESMLNGRIYPVGQVDGFTLELGASGSFFPAHERLPMKAYFFDLADDNSPSPYLGYADLSQLRNGKGYHLPKKGSVQLTLFNPNKFVVKMFVIGYDFEDMPANCQTFLRQRTVYMPIQRKTDVAPDTWINTSGSREGKNEESKPNANDNLSVPDFFWISSSSKTSSLDPTALSLSSCSCSSVSSASSASSTNSLASGSCLRAVQPAYLRYLVHLRFHTTRSGRLYLHTDLRLIFARDTFEFDPRVATYELRSFVDAPSNPRYSPKKWTKRPRTSVPFVPRITSP